MKIVLSRKGFDSGNARMASPILPDGTPLSFPIPRPRGHCYSYDALTFRGRPLGAIIRELANGPLPFEDKAHADPDLDEERLPRKAGWRPIFGQTGGDQTHLGNEGVGVGDIFLFFGWFRRTLTCPDGSVRYAQPRDDFHAIFGWLQVGELHKVNGRSAKTLPAWSQDHPHVASPDSFDANNTIYIASEHLNLCGADLPIPGGGAFPRFSSALRLTAPEGPRTCWTLPKWFLPGTDKPALSYHGDPARWSIKGEHAILQAVARGQEFVLDTQYYPQAPSWVSSLFEATMGDTEPPHAQRIGSSFASAGR